jgi:hypothetical protein
MRVVSARTARNTALGSIVVIGRAQSRAVEEESVIIIRGLCAPEVAYPIAGVGFVRLQGFRAFFVGANARLRMIQRAAKFSGYD